MAQGADATVGAPGPAGMVVPAWLVQEAVALAREPGRRILGIAGPPGGGKSTLALAVVAHVTATLGTDAARNVPMDGYHLADVELRRLGLLDRKGIPASFDAAGYVALLRRLREQGSDTVYAPAFDRMIEQPVAGSIPVPPETALIVTEGNYVLLDSGPWAGVRALLDRSWFTGPKPGTPADDLRNARLLARHIEFGKTPEQALAWMATVDTPNALLVDATRSRADVVVDGPM
jgi:pantothenate kinase